MNKIYDPVSYKVVFFSSAPIGAPFLEALAKDDRFDVTGVVTMPDAPAGRGMKMQENVIKATAKKIFGIQNKLKVILLHGFAWKNYWWRKDEIKQWCEYNSAQFFAPELESNLKPNLDIQLKQLTELYGNILDENTIIIWHSLWGTLAAHFVVRSNKKINKLICIAPANPTQEFTSINDPIVALNNIWLRKYVDETIDYEKIATLTHHHIIYLSDNDVYIPYAKTQEYFMEHAPTAIIQTYHAHWHFSSSDLRNFSTLIKDLDSTILSPNDDPNLIQTPEKIHPDKSDEGKEFVKRLEEKKPDYIVVIAYGKIIPQAILDIPLVAPINVHGSLLPKYRWASPIQSVFLHHEKETWITIMKMAASLDTGDMVAVQKFPILFDWTTRNVIEKMQEVGPDFLTDTLWKLGKWMYGYEKQDDSKATVCGKIEKESGEINPWEDSIEDIYAKYRAYAMWPKIYFVYKEKRFVIEDLLLDEGLYTQNTEQVLFSADKKLHPAVKNIVLKPEGKKWVSWTDFVNSYLQ